MFSQGHDTPMEVGEIFYEDETVPVVDETALAEYEDKKINIANTNRQQKRRILKNRSLSMQHFTDDHLKEQFKGNTFHRRTMSVNETTDINGMGMNRFLRSAELRSEMRRSVRPSNGDHGSVAARVKDWEIQNPNIGRINSYSRSRSFREGDQNDSRWRDQPSYRKHSKSVSDLTSANSYSTVWMEEHCVSASEAV